VAGRPTAAEPALLPANYHRKNKQTMRFLPYNCYVILKLYLSRKLIECTRRERKTKTITVDIIFVFKSIVRTHSLEYSAMYNLFDIDE